MKKYVLTATAIALIIAVIVVWRTSDKKDAEPTYTVVVSLDAFRWDYPDMYDTPNLDRIASEGLRTVMTPSYPASTFPNHYTIATGMVPDHNGIVNSLFWNPTEQQVFSMGDTTTRYNPAYYMGEPIWVTAGRQGVKTASIYWVGSDVAVRGQYPTYYHPWNDEPRLSFEKRVARTLELLQMPEADRPRLVMTYFDEPDGVGHHFGPRSTETGAMVHHLDSLMGVLYDGIKALPYGNRVNLVITADHGMTDISDERFVNWQDYVKEEWYERAVCFNPVNIFVREGYRDSVLNALKGVEHIYVWTHGNVPDSLNYGNSERTGDVIIAPEIGWQCADKPRGLKGQHGYAPQLPDMRVIFYAAGPSFGKHGNILRPMLNNIDIYPTLAHIIGIEPAETDGVIATDLLSVSK